VRLRKDGTEIHRIGMLAEVYDYETGKLVGHIQPRGRFVPLAAGLSAEAAEVESTPKSNVLILDDDALDLSLLANLLFLRLFVGSVLKSFGLSMHIYERIYVLFAFHDPYPWVGFTPRHGNGCGSWALKTVIGGRRVTKVRQLHAGGSD